jgi:hypothetical protein
MPNGEIKTETYSNRAFACGYYKEEYNYAKIIKLLFKRVIKDYKDSSNDDCTIDIRSTFDRLYLSSSFEGPRRVYVKDKLKFDTFCKDCANNLSKFISDNDISKLFSEYKYKKIVGRIDCVSTINRKDYTVDFSFYNKELTYHRLYYHKFNCYLYNKVNSINNDILIFIVPDNLYYLMKYDENTYTINDSYISSQGYSPGMQCVTCKVKDCRPRLLNDPRRL